MQNFTEELKQLLELRRSATDEAEKELIDKAINKLIDNINTGTVVQYPGFWYERKETPPYLNNPIMCNAQKGN